MDAKAEEQILDFWKKNKIYEKSKKNNAKGEKFYFMDGPPYASGDIHMGTALNKIVKDIAMRSQRLQGRDVFDRPGYDTHGVPIEFQVEKEIGTKSKKDIEKYGEKKFIDKCKDYATKYIGVMNEEFMNLGAWMDWENPYLTLSDEYIEAIWSAFKKAEEKKLLYLGGYPVHICTRCGTAVAYNEIEYGKQKDTSVFVKFPLKKGKNVNLIIWTTTPWTLPANTGVMVHPEVDHQEIEVMEGERWIMAKELVPKVMQILERGFTVKDEYKGKTMKGWEYENPLSKNLKMKLKNAYRVVLSARYVTTEDGSGLVHTAPGHGKEDYEVGKENGLDAPCPVGTDGMMTEEAGKYAGKKARVVDAEIIQDLEGDNKIVWKLEYEHDYPLCWRDKTPLLMVSIPQWFLKISEVQKKLLKSNDEVNWVPKFMQLRMKAWLEGIGDWPVSRQRYWGSPLPIWICEETGERIVVGSIDELKKLSGAKKIDMHKPEIDKIVIKKNGKVFKRVPEVLDVWFDSGVSSWAAFGGTNSKEFKKYWPANLNIEGKDQFRGWWNSQIILSEITFGKKPFENIVVHGMVLDVSKSKMSKSKGNIVAPKDVIAKYGRDYMRYYFAKLSKGEDFSFDEDEFSDINKFYMMLGNVNNFVNQIDGKKEKIEIEDKWIISKYNTFLKDVTETYNGFKFPEVTQKIEEFLTTLSRDYIQMIRDRSDETSQVLNEIRIGLLKVLAPIMPFTSEMLWQKLRERKLVKEESIHLSDWPKYDKKKINLEIEKDFIRALGLIKLGLAERDKAKVGLRWPLAKVVVYDSEKLDKHVQEVISRQLNVKKVEFSSSKELKVELDLKISKELEAEGFAREISRKVQAERKNQGLQKSDVIELKLYLSDKLTTLLEEQKRFIMERTNSKSLKFIRASSGGESGILSTIKDEKVGIEFNRV